MPLSHDVRSSINRERWLVHLAFRQDPHIGFFIEWLIRSRGVYIIIKIEQFVVIPSIQQQSDSSEVSCRKLSWGQNLTQFR